MTQHERLEWIGEINKIIALERKQQAKNLEQDMKKIIESAQKNAAGNK